MTQAKKTTAHKPAAAAHKAASAATHTNHKATAAAMSMAESARNSAESMAKLCTDTMKECFATGSEEAQKAHEKVFAVGREGAENFSRAIEAFSRTMNDMVALGRENADAAVEVSHIAADVARSINDELVSCANSNFSDNIELCKESFACRTMNDVMELQNKWLSTNMENFFNQSARLAEMCFQFATEAAEPINERVAEATERFNKSLAA